MLRHIFYGEKFIAKIGINIGSNQPLITPNIIDYALFFY